MKNWNLEIGKMPEFDGEYLCYIHQKQECGTILYFYRVITCSFNNWLIPTPSWEIVAWKELYKDPKQEMVMIKDLVDAFSGLLSDVQNLLSENDIEWQQAGYYKYAKELLLKIKQQQ
jgi:hypothetical protein